MVRQLRRRTERQIHLRLASPSLRREASSSESARNRQGSGNHADLLHENYGESSHFPSSNSPLRAPPSSIPSSSSPPNSETSRFVSSNSCSVSNIEGDRVESRDRGCLHTNMSLNESMEVVSSFLYPESTSTAARGRVQQDSCAAAGNQAARTAAETAQKYDLVANPRWFASSSSPREKSTKVYSDDFEDAAVQRRINFDLFSAAKTAAGAGGDEEGADNNSAEVLAELETHESIDRQEDVEALQNRESDAEEEDDAVESCLEEQQSAAGGYAPVEDIDNFQDVDQNYATDWRFKLGQSGGVKDDSVTGDGHVVKSKRLAGRAPETPAVGRPVPVVWTTPEPRSPARPPRFPLSSSSSPSLRSPIDPSSSAEASSTGRRCLKRSLMIPPATKPKRQSIQKRPRTSSLAGWKSVRRKPASSSSKPSTPTSSRDPRAFRRPISLLGSSSLSSKLSPGPRSDPAAGNFPSTVVGGAARQRFQLNDQQTYRGSPAGSWVSARVQRLGFVDCATSPRFSRSPASGHQTLEQSDVAAGNGNDGCGGGGGGGGDGGYDDADDDADAKVPNDSIELEDEIVTSGSDDGHVDNDGGSIFRSSKLGRPSGMATSAARDGDVPRKGAILTTHEPVADSLEPIEEFSASQTALGHRTNRRASACTVVPLTVAHVSEVMESVADVSSAEFSNRAVHRLTPLQRARNQAAASFLLGLAQNYQAQGNSGAAINCHYVARQIKSLRWPIVANEQVRVIDGIGPVLGRHLVDFLKSWTPPAGRPSTSGAPTGHREVDFAHRHRPKPSRAALKQVQLNGAELEQGGSQPDRQGQGTTGDLELTPLTSWPGRSRVETQAVEKTTTVKAVAPMSGGGSHTATTTTTTTSGHTGSSKGSGGQVVSPLAPSRRGIVQVPDVGTAAAAMVSGGSASVADKNWNLSPSAATAWSSARHPLCLPNSAKDVADGSSNPFSIHSLFTAESTLS